MLLPLFGDSCFVTMLEDVEFLYNDDEFVLLVTTVADVGIFELELLLLFELLFFEDSVLLVLVEGGG